MKEFDNMGNRIKQLRIEHGITVKDLAEELGISQSMLSNYENGNSAPRKQEIWQGLARKFGVDIGYIMGVSDIKNIDSPDAIFNSANDYDLNKFIFKENLDKLTGKDIDSTILENPELVEWVQAVIFAYEYLSDTKHGIADLNTVIKNSIDGVLTATKYFSYNENLSETKEKDRLLKFYEAKENVCNGLDKLFKNGENPIYVDRTYVSNHEPEKES
ncbi:helix-turn-helix domain-containing protein [Candidatus Enterococcus clewellii]|uniref:HTH cro/C1-type domain-containing protein n=1 Tax=Candidatus Enterococcus clewellii TaxID=1834193 RepID=A0A242K5S4_9ENTE|nr:helix-turn-helix transcriptional regulator [Enterococcus sp. 9E7_DIV0242]OTP13734.1 hypothetical protein A5888_003214 [Enterococcus sp. 9E7_DIV0242]